jgi:type IV pilus assembly protein PilQ
LIIEGVPRKNSQTAYKTPQTIRSWKTMGILLKVASLGLFSAIGIVTAVSVATHYQPADRTSNLEMAGLNGDEPDRNDESVGVPRDVLPPPGQSRTTIELPTSIQPQPLATRQTGGVTIVTEIPASSWEPAPLPPAQRSPRPVMGPVVMATVDPALDPSKPWQGGHRIQPEPPLVPPLDSHVASYQPLVTAQFNLLLKAINKMEETQQETAEIVSRLQDRQDQTPSTVESDPPQATKTGVHSVSMNDEDLLTLIFEDSDIKAVLHAIGVEAGLNILSSESVAGLVSATLTDVEIETALDAILKSRGLVSRREGNIVYVGTHAELHFVEHGGDVISTRVYRPNYITAKDMQSLITPMLSQDTGQITISAASEVGIGSDSASAGGDSYSGEEVVVVRDFEGILSQIDELVAVVDRMPRQVSIEAMILSVALDDKSELGVDFELLRQKDTIRVTSGTPLVNLTSGSFSDGLKIGFLDTSVFLFLNALETIGDTTVIASPRIMCLNKQRAEILIGAELGYISTTITETAATQSVEFLEVGTQLSIRPFISSDGMIRMEVHPELSAGSVRVEGGFTLPDKEVTQITTNVLCPDGATVVIGGLIREDLVTTTTQIPVLGNLPWIGPAFRQRREEMDRREIIVLLTLRIIQEEDLWREGRAMSSQFKDRRDVVLAKMNPLGKRHFADRYVGKATAAWAAGDVDMALRYCNLALHFDPNHRSAVLLRREVISVAPGLEVSVHDHLRHGLGPGQLPHLDYSKLGYPWQRPDHVPAGMMAPALEEVELDEVELEAVEELVPPVHTIEIGPPRTTSAGR